MTHLIALPDRTTFRVATRATSILAAMALLAAAPSTAARAEPGGCLKYGAAGAVGGHVAHHGVLGAVGGCAAGMYVRHKFRKEARAKAALYDQEHPGAGGTYQQRATAYDVEHSTSPGSMAPGAAGQPAAAAGQGDTQL